jgi:hypothetical protein
VSAQNCLKEVIRTRCTKAKQWHSIFIGLLGDRKFGVKSILITGSKGSEKVLSGFSGAKDEEAKADALPRGSTISR